MPNIKPAPVILRPVKLRKVLERVDLVEGKMTRFVYDESAPLYCPSHDKQGSTVYISDASVFTEATLSVFNAVGNHVFTLTEEEYIDHE